MFRKTLNRAVIRLRIETVSPLLIRAGDTGLDSTRADLSCVRTRHAVHGSTVYIPGSSAKGVIRSAAEALIRGLGHGMACDPLNHDANCVRAVREEAERRKERGDPTGTAETHRRHCKACRLFGSTRLRGRCAIRDLFPFAEEHDDASRANLVAANRTETRNGVGIDRIAGSVKVGPFDFEMVPPGVWFAGDIALTNVQAWQLGLLAAGLRELHEGFVQLGSTKSRGLGVVTVKVERVLFEQADRRADRPLGVGRMVDAAERADYGLLDEVDLPRLGAPKTRGLSRRFEAGGAAAEAWLEDTERALEGLA